jgi:hypothetical protein
MTPGGLAPLKLLIRGINPRYQRSNPWIAASIPSGLAWGVACGVACSVT